MFLVSLSEFQANEVMNYDAIIKVTDKKLQHDSELEDKGQLLSFQDIIDHWTTKGSSSSYEVIVNREDGHATWEPVSVMRHNYPIYLAKYTIDNAVLDHPGWKQLHRYVKNSNKVN